MSSGAMKSVTGVYTGTGAALDILKVGFKPSYLRILCFTSQSIVEKFAELHETDAFTNHATAGTISEVAAGNGGPTLENAGFSLGTHASVNASGEVYAFFATE